MYMPPQIPRDDPATILYNFNDLCTSVCPGAVDLLSSNVPEAARFADIVHAAGVDVQRPTCRLVCARYLHESGGGIELIEYVSKGPCFPYSNCAGRCLTGFNFEVSKEKVWYDLRGIL